MLLWLNANLGFVLLGAAAGLVVFWLLRLEWRLNRLLAGRKATSLEETINQLIKRVGQTDQVNEAIKNHLVKAEDRIRRSIKHVKVVRFNPFQTGGVGGNQSFAAAFLDEDGNGAVISSIYSREKVSVYAKPVNGYQSEHELSEEEKTVIGGRQ